MLEEEEEGEGEGERRLSVLEASGGGPSLSLTLSPSSLFASHRGPPCPKLGEEREGRGKEKGREGGRGIGSTCPVFLRTPLVE